ncbi:hypothetical protein JQK87_00325 [Streptomyces sp. G44]|uniref:hypothetical protein n=1 Tax=Streptomyces sp. G44 TaxID=2807632 RepID=UPI001960344C|nr:hypothetical protein [Streptomyces sp. G44]MBM7166896.1 hypothetical protein [Streptomyces sp. G44]
MPQDPDFELYDNVGRDADKIVAARYGIATRSDLLRWAKRDSEAFLAQHPLPDKPLPSPDLAPPTWPRSPRRRPLPRSAPSPSIFWMPPNPHSGR